MRRRLQRCGGLIRVLGIPGIPRVPGVVARIALREPRLVPVSIRWRAASGGLGLLVSSWTESRGGAPASVLRRIGESQGAAVREHLGYGDNPVECARVVALANRLYAIRARVEVRTQAQARVITPGCPWSREPWWTAAACSAFSAYEQGLVAGLNPRVVLRYEAKRTRGDASCVGVYAWKGE